MAISHSFSGFEGIVPLTLEGTRLGQFKQIAEPLALLNGKRLGNLFAPDNMNLG